MTDVHHACIFCKIAQGNDEKTEILHKDEKLVVFRDIRPATPHHYLVVTMDHIPDAKQLKYEHINLVEQMVEVGKDVVQKQGGDVNDLRMGFHWPPFHMISHLHLHVISSTRQMGFIAKGIFMERAYWFAKVDWVIERLKKMKSTEIQSEKLKKDETSVGLNKSFMQHRGVWMWDNSQPELFPTFKGRPSDIWICSFPRSGTTLVQELTYLVQTLDFQGAASRPLDERFTFAEVVNEDLPFYKGLAALENAESPRMIKSHFHYFLLPEDLKRGCGKIVYVYRNPKPVVVSLYKLLKYLRTPMADSLEEFIEMFLEDRVYGSPWAEHLREFWDHRTDTNILFLQYEDIVKEKTSVVRNIAEFLNRDLSAGDIEKIVEHTDIENMKNNAMVNFSVQESVWNTDKTEGVYINKGKTSNWKDVIHPELQHRIDRMVKEELGDTDIKFE